MMFQNLAATNDVDFTSREIQIIELIQQGLSSKEIADQLSLSEKTITRHRQNIAQKAGTNGKNGLGNIFLRTLHQVCKPW